MFWLYSAYTNHISPAQRWINTSYWQKFFTHHLLPDGIDMEYTPTHILLKFPSYTFPEYSTIENMVLEADKVVVLDELEENLDRMWGFDWIDIPDYILSDIKYNLFDTHKYIIYGFVQWPFFVVRWANERFFNKDVRKKSWLSWGIICSELGYIAIEDVCNKMIELNFNVIKYQQLLNKLHEWNINNFHCTDLLNVLIYGTSLGLLKMTHQPKMEKKFEVNSVSY